MNLKRTVLVGNSLFSTDNFQGLHHPHKNNSGFSLLELLIAALLVMMISAMIYSVLNVGIKFSHKGEAKLLAIAREQGFISLIHQQINGTLYDRKKKKMKIMGDDDVLMLTTNRPLLSPEMGIVLAVYRYDAEEQTIYYTEKVDFYNPDYDEDFIPDLDEMYAIITKAENFLMEYDEETGEVLVAYEGAEYIFKPKCFPRQS